MNLEELVTKDYLTAQFAEHSARIDTRFTEQTGYIDTRFAQERAYTDSKFAEQNANFKLLFWMVGFVITVSVLPYFERLLS